MAEYYEFVTVWRFDAPSEMVWAEIKNSDAWGDWWKGVLKIENLKDGDASGAGAVRRSTWKSALPYKLIFDSEIVRIEELKLIEARAFGQLEGTGLWQFAAEEKKQTRVQYDWRVKTTKRWMNHLAPLAKPFFRWNHNVIMKWGRRRVGAETKLPVTVRIVSKRPASGSLFALSQLGNCRARFHRRDFHRFGRDERAFFAQIEIQTAA